MSNQGRPDSPDFDASRYERPNKNWLCGHTCDGCPCRIGPSPSGECRATTECTPQLVAQPGETKGTWKCTRPKEHGGACPEGPLPDGSCCKTIPKCRPVRSLRARRGLVTRAVVIASVALLLVFLGGGLRERFINPAPLSTPHSTAEFARLAAQHAGLPPEAAGQGCVACHAETRADFATLASEAVQTARASLAFDRLASPHPKDFSRMDASCATCHTQHAFHQPNVAAPASCSACHLEHQGSGPLAPVTAHNCTACHGDAEHMRLASTMGRALPASAFAKPLPAGLVVHESPRPLEGYTRLILGFADGHPEFQFLREKQTDANTLKFNHALHLSGEGIPTVDGRPLDCASCHQPDASGAFMLPVSFERNCRACHSLDFDETTPGLQLPHGDAIAARAFLRSLPTQYADHARRRLGLTDSRDVDAFVREKITGLRERARSGENLEHATFFSDGSTTPASNPALGTAPSRARFAGCAYCHEVVPQTGDATPKITPVRTPRRWMQHASFTHAKHTTMACTDCHAAAKTSALTQDILLPSIQNCVTCHAPQQRASDNCTTCHGYHNTPPAVSAPIAGFRPDRSAPSKPSDQSASLARAP